ncbi:MAG: putative ATPase [Candidatus Paceibacteria bacterium]|jgi:putative ATPase
MSSGLFGDLDGPAADPIVESMADAPLADRMRPRSLDEYVGQTQLVGEGKVLSSLLDGGLTQSLILWGPPGTGKTTLARLIAARTGLRFVAFSAVLSGVKELRTIMAGAEQRRAKSGERTLLFVDEIHRFNKAQQDAFLPHVERGDIILIGATTENPSFEVISALLSRVRTLVLEPLSVADLVRLLRRALEDEEHGLASVFEASDDILSQIAHACDGDARRSLTALETAAAILDEGENLGPERVAEVLQRKVLHYDKTGEEHFNLVSALHKSIRNSNENAALYWLTRMMEAGEDGAYLARRLIRIASEDVGLADPFALRVALDAAEAFHRLGYPEGKLALVQCAVYMARARKSNAIYAAHAMAEKDVVQSSAEPVPLHLRNASTQMMKDAGYGKGYRYAHDDPDAESEMSCMPPGLEGRRYFKRPVPPENPS